MQQNQFDTALQLDPKTLPDFREPLREIREKYPWFAAAHVLLCKADHIAKHESYEENLRLAAVYVNDREALFDILMKDRFKDTVERFEKELAQNEEPTRSIASPPPEEHESAQNLQDTEKNADKQPEAAEEEAESHAKDSADETLEPEETGESEVQHAPIEEEDIERKQPQKPAVRPEDLDDLQREMVVAAISSTIQLEQDEEPDVEEDFAADERSAGTKPEDEPEAAAEKNDNGEKEDQIASEDAPVAENQQTSTSAHSPFTAWLLNKARETHWHEEERRIFQTKRSLDPEDAAEAADAETGPNKQKEATDQQALINAFIAKDPKITPKRSDMFSSENLAKMSLVDDDQWVTETMAEVYAGQGKIRKAIKAYKLLSLKYPEKSIYFANRIKKLREGGKSN